MCHWYIEMDPNCTPRHEEEHRKSVEPAYVRLQPAAAIEAPGKGRGSKAKTAIGKTATGKETASKELLAKNPSAKPSTYALPVADALAKANDRPASLRSTTPSVADGGATTDKARPIRRKEQPDGEAFDQVEQSADLSLTNSVQITAPSILLSRDGPTSTIRSALKICVSDDDEIEEHLMNTNSMNLHVPPASENFIRFVKMANGGRLSYLNGVEGEHPTVQLVIANMPEGLPVLGINEHLPMWNSYTTFTKFLVANFGFLESHLDDDGALLLIHPIGL